MCAIDMKQSLQHVIFVGVLCINPQVVWWFGRATTAAFDVFLSSTREAVDANISVCRFFIWHVWNNGSELQNVLIVRFLTDTARSWHWMLWHRELVLDTDHSKTALQTT